NTMKSPASLLTRRSEFTVSLVQACSNQFMSQSWLMSSRRGPRVLREVPIPVEWEGIKLDIGFRADFIVEGMIIVEAKSVEKSAPVYKKQLLTQLRLADKRLGLLINFSEVLLKDGICRVVNGLSEGEL